MPRGNPHGTPGRHTHRAGRDQSRTLAAAAGLRPRRTHEDRDRPRLHRLRRAPRPHHRFAHRHDHRQRRLEELDRIHAGRSGRSRRNTKPSRARAPATPISPAPSNTIFPTPATSSNAPAPAKPPPASPSERSSSSSSRHFGIEVLSHVIAVGPQPARTHRRLGGNRRAEHEARSAPRLRRSRSRTAR